MSMFLPSDVDPVLADRRQMAVMLARTTKPLVVVTYDVEAMLDAIAMAEAVAGGPAPCASARPWPCTSTSPVAWSTTATRCASC